MKCYRCGLDADHLPCCSSHQRDLCCECYRKTHFVEVRPCCTPDEERRAMEDAVSLGMVDP